MSFANDPISPVRSLIQVSWQHLPASHLLRTSPPQSVLRVTSGKGSLKYSSGPIYSSIQNPGPRRPNPMPQPSPQRPLYKLSHWVFTSPVLAHAGAPAESPSHTFPSVPQRLFNKAHPHMVFFPVSNPFQSPNQVVLLSRK